MKKPDKKAKKTAPKTIKKAVKPAKAVKKTVLKPVKKVSAPKSVKEIKKPEEKVLPAKAPKTILKTEEKIQPKGALVMPKKYFYGVGRRKSSVAQVRLYEDGEKNGVTVNEKPFEQRFPVSVLRDAILAPLRMTGTVEKFFVSALVNGGGMTGQAEAIRHGMARALTLFDPSLRVTLKKAGFLTRDPREKERKKPGLKRARRAPQWSKR